jgi:hypothetical protein
MSQHYPMHPYQGYYAPMYQGGDARYLFNAARTGAIVGATGAAALSLHGVRSGGMSWQQAAVNTAKGGLSAGLATAAAAAVGRTFGGGNSVVSLAAALATGTAVMYVLADAKQGAGNDE